ncbi:MAG: family 1 glycosylhydrolase [Roseburia sp.]|nr:family 1 glycosylhydrolase [Roseburia sp.]MCM1098976.1 family 1 glycosylhydrolase [Ruminococcus flavefaciens]
MGFSDTFYWGASGGAFREEGRGRRRKSREDIVLMKQLRLKAYGLAVSWADVMPEEGRPDQAVLADYRRQAEELFEAGIRPVCTLFQGEMPKWLQKKGGWLWEESGDCFAEAVEAAAEAFSGLGLIWMIAGNARFFLENTVYERAVRALRGRAAPDTKVGIVLEGRIWMPQEQKEDAAAIEAAQRRTFAELPEEIPPGIDFVAYCGGRAGGSAVAEPVKEELCPGFLRTTEEWAITPRALYWAARFLHERYGLPVLIAENGMANLDFVMSDGLVHDQQRIEYIKSYLRSLKQAAEEGYPVTGYLYRSMKDCMEWPEEYDKRFGLVYVDFRTGECIPKDSAYWYARVISENGENL